MTFYAENATLQDAIDYAIKHGHKYVKSFACEGFARWKVTDDLLSSGVVEWERPRKGKEENHATTTKRS